MGLGCDKDAIAKKIDVAKSKLIELSSSAAALAKAMVATSGELPELIMEAERLQREKSALILEIEDAEQKLAMEPNSMLDDSYANEVLGQLYLKDPAAKEVRAECNVRLSRAISAIWHFAYDVAIVGFKNGTAMPVPLSPKTPLRERPILQKIGVKGVSLQDVLPMQATV